MASASFARPSSSTQQWVSRKAVSLTRVHDPCWEEAEREGHDCESPSKSHGTTRTVVILAIGMNMSLLVTQSVC
jgi:hypothetical protein